MDYKKYCDAVEQLNTWTKLYDEGNPLVPDTVWDKLYYDIFMYEKEHPEDILATSPTQTISYEVISKLEKVKHNHLMLSLAKTKNLNEFSNFISKYPCILMPKLDGLTCSLHYQNGCLVNAETRGNGEIGENILHNAKVIRNIPWTITYKDDLIIDGEVICTKENFAPFEKEYKNPRNFAAGSLRLLDSKECAKRNLSFIAWDVISPIDTQLSEKLAFIHTLGFDIVDFTTVYGEEVEKSIDEIKAWAEYQGWPIDGIVAKYNDVETYTAQGSTSHHFNGGLAFKFYDETYSTRLIYIDWTMGRTGQLTPVAVFEPVEIDGTIVERASLHNVSVMHEILGDCAYRGEGLEIFKANQIIPQIASAGPKYDYGYVVANGGVSVDTIERCPCCGEDLSLRQDGIALNYFCDNPNCEGKLINRLDHFCGKKGLDIKGLSKATLEKLIDWGWLTNFYSIYNLDLHRNEWIKKPGFGVASVDKILKAIEDSRHTELWRLIAAIGIPEIGITASKTLANYYKTWGNFRVAVAEDTDFSHLPDFGYIMSRNINEYNDGDWDDADDVASHMIIDAAAAPDTKKVLDEKVFCITGKVYKWKNRDSLKEYIESLGGKVTGAVTTKTDYLINNDNTSTTQKNQSAIKLGKPILTEEEFSALVDELLAK